MLIFVIYALLAFFALIVYLYRKLFAKLPDMTNKVVVITGASSGLGFSFAQLSLNLGASHLFLIARNEKNLNEAAAKLKKTDQQTIHPFPGDVSNYDVMKEIFENIATFGKPIDYLFANAGFAKPGMIENLSENDFINQMNTNYLGAAFVSKLAIPLMTKGSHISFSGSVCSVMSFAGFSAYSPSKYALKGLADSLRNDLKQKNIFLHLNLLSNMDTPGLKKENETKPQECSAIEGTAQTFSPDFIAEYVLKRITQGDYTITMEALVWFINEFGYGICPSNNIFLQLLIAPFLPLIRFGTLIYIDTLAKLGSKPKNE